MLPTLLMIERKMKYKVFYSLVLTFESGGLNEF